MQDTVQKTDICVTCPSSQWGDSNFCLTHQKKILEVINCQQWDAKLYVEKGGQLSTHDPSKLMDIIQRTEEDVRDYRWMQREIERIIKELNDLGLYSSMVAQWGIEAIMPKAQGSRPTVNDKQLQRKMERLERLQNKVNQIDNAIGTVSGEREQTVITCMLDGVRMNMIAQHVGVSRVTLNELKRSVITQLANEIYKEELERG